MSARTEPTRPIRSRAWAAGAVVALLFGLAACGDDDDDDVSAGSGDGTTVTTAGATGSDDPYGQGTTAGDTGGDAAADTVEAIDFELTSITVAPGAEVTFENKGEAPHTMTADDDAFDTGTVEPGASATVAAPAEPGDYPFHCEIHPAMTGTLTVEG